MKDFLKNEEISLIRFSEKFITPEYLSWLNNHTVTQYLNSGRLPISRDDIHIKNDDSNIRFAIVYTKDGAFNYIGTVGINNIDWISRKCNVGYMIGDESFWGKGIATKVIGMVAEYIFDRLGLNKITAGVVDGNVGSARALAKNGFKVYGINPCDYYLCGKLLDTHLFYKLRTTK
jgi:RimJ/RimL family protein N-acetyltransferase